MIDHVCQMTSIGKAFHGRPVLCDLDLTVAPGEMVAVTGDSGSGKTTLLNIVGLLERPDRGEMRLFGRPAPAVGSRKATALLRNKLGYLFQNFALIDGDSVDANLRIAQAYAGGSRAARGQARAAVLEAVGLPDAARRRVYELSGGEQQRIAIARLMLKPCDLVLADEPTGSLDAANRDIVLRLLRQLNTTGKSVIIVTHDAQVAATCHRRLSLPVAHGALQPQ
jgi:putative ABC transport system ATP-binding protein